MLTTLIKLKNIFAQTCLALAMLIFSVLIYVRYLYPYADFLQISTTINDLTLKVLAANTNLKDYFFSLLFFLIAYPLCYFFLKAKYHLIAALCISALILHYSGFIYYALNHNKTSTLYEEEYISPETLKITFPKKPRNLILIYLESFEQNFAYKKYYGQNLIPNLSALQQEGQYSTAHVPITGSTYSIAAFVASHCGLTNTLSPNRDIYQAKFFLPQAVCLPQILSKNGYQTMLIKAADISFSRTDTFATSHGYDKAIGAKEILSLIDKDSIPAHLGTFEGINDKTLFEYAKYALQSFDKDKPFMLTLFSLDTHLPAYYKDPSCPTVFNDLRDAYLCTDKTVYNFITWLKASPYYADTTVVIIGDHLLPTRLKTNGRPHRGIYNLFLNLPEGLSIEKNKTFSTLDLAPTILESLGLTLNPHAFGLGRSLFAKKKTLVEKESAKKLNLRLIQKSNLLEKLNTPKEQRAASFIPYTPQTLLDKKEILTYADVYEEILGAYYLDKLNFKLPEQADYTVTLTFTAVTLNNADILFYANNKKIKSFSTKNKRPPYTITFNINKKLLKDKTLTLSFRNQTGVQTAMQMGIAPISLIIAKNSAP